MKENSTRTSPKWQLCNLFSLLFLCYLLLSKTLQSGAGVILTFADYRLLLLERQKRSA